MTFPLPHYTPDDLPFDADLYEVRLDLRSFVWVSVQADSEDEADERARASYNVGDASGHQVVSSEVRRA